MSLARDIVDRIFFPDRDVHAIPVLDGGFSPNQRLEAARVLAEIPAADGIACDTDGRLFVSSGQTVFTLSAGEAGEPQCFAQENGAIGALAMGPGGWLLAAVAGRGMVAFDRHGKEAARLTEVGGVPLRCVTAIAVGNDGTIALTDGARDYEPAQWLQHLMGRAPSSGRLVACSADFSGARVVKDGLSWPAGVTFADSGNLLVSEAWSHRLLAISLTTGAVRTLVKNFAGYPSRLAPGAAGGTWCAFFAIRSQLTEFVLREEAFRVRKIHAEPSDLWIGPSLGGRFDYRAPTQVGRIKKLGIQKPWAPARSYGLVARLDETGTAVESLHSRVSGSLHGITDMVERDGRLFVTSKGHGKVAAATLGDRQDRP